MSARKIKRSLRVHRYSHCLLVPGKPLSFLEQYRRWNQ
jgi:hypothetical protein